MVTFLHITIWFLQLDGCATTLHPNIHGGILARRDHSDHMDTLSRHDIGMLYLAIFTIILFKNLFVYPLLDHYFIQDFLVVERNNT